MDLATSKVFCDVEPKDMYKFLVLRNNLLCAVVCKYYDRKRLQSLASSLILDPGDNQFKHMPYFVAYEDLFPNVYHGFVTIESLSLVSV